MIVLKMVAECSCIFIFLFMYVLEWCASVRVNTFEPSGCRNQILHEFERYSMFESRTNLECAEHCSRDIYCISYNYLPYIKQCHLNKGLIEDNCTNAVFAPQNFYFQKTEFFQKCLHNGTWNANALKCDCIYGYIGTKCERLMKECGEGTDEAYYSGKRDFFYIFPPTASKPFKIRCTMLWGGRNIIIQHYNPTFLFNRGWQDFQNGFSDSSGDSFWLGLENIHHITMSNRNKIYLEIRDPSMIILRNRYDNFRIGNESTGYQLMNIGTEVGNQLSPCLPDLVGSSFSTYDNDQDKNSTVNCAVKYRIGWWFNEQFCSKCNPLGELNIPTGGSWNGDTAHAFWPGESWNPTGIKMWLQNFNP